MGFRIEKYVAFVGDHCDSEQKFTSFNVVCMKMAFERSTGTASVVDVCFCRRLHGVYLLIVNRHK